MTLGQKLTWDDFSQPMEMAHIWFSILINRCFFLFVDPHFGTISEKTMGHAQMEKRVQRKGRTAGVALPFMFWAWPLVFPDMVLSFSGPWWFCDKELQGTNVCIVMGKKSNVQQHASSFQLFFHKIFSWSANRIYNHDGVIQLLFSFYSTLIFFPK